MMYIGCYLVATLPTRKIEVYSECPTCGLKSNTPFCPFDGSSVPTMFVEETVCLDEIFENVDGNGDEMFTEWKNDYRTPKIQGIELSESIITVGDYQNPTSNKHFSRVSDYHLPINELCGMPQIDFSIDNWPLLTDALTRQGIRFRKEFGVINFDEQFEEMPY